MFLEDLDVGSIAILVTVKLIFIILILYFLIRRHKRQPKQQMQLYIVEAQPNVYVDFPVKQLPATQLPSNNASQTR